MPKDGRADWNCEKVSEKVPVENIRDRLPSRHRRPGTLVGYGFSILARESQLDL